MHLGALLLFEGPPPDSMDFLHGIESRLHLLPRYRQKLAFPRFEMGRPLWVDDPCFNLEYHVRNTALPRPGSFEQLLKLAGRIYSQRLDRSKPLWETWLVQGLDDDSFGVIMKIHHTMADGVAGMDIASTLFDFAPVPRQVEPEPWTPQPPPGDLDLIADGMKDMVMAPLGLASRTLRAVRSPGEATQEVRERVDGIGEILVARLEPVPPTPLNSTIGPHRRIERVHTRLADFKRVKNELGGTVNDVVLTVVAGALGRWLRYRGVRTEGLELCALVPVSIRGDGEYGDLGNRVAAVRGPLPVYAEDPVARLEIVSEAMRKAKGSRQTLGAQVVGGLYDFAPPTILGVASRLELSTRRFNLTVSNVAGPQTPLYLLGRELEAFVPLTFLIDDQALAIAVLSYNGKVDFGLLGDYDVMFDLNVVADAIRQSLAELVEAAAGVPVAAVTG